MPNMSGLMANLDGLFGLGCLLLLLFISVTKCLISDIVLLRVMRWHGGRSD
jgi:hypothetical protein